MKYDANLKNLMWAYREIVTFLQFLYRLYFLVLEPVAFSQMNTSLLLWLFSPND